MPTSQRNLCVLFADVSGSGGLYEKRGDAEALYAVDRCIKRMERAVAVHAGRIVKIIGDEMMAVFEAADSAVQAACEMQQRIDDLPPVSGVKLSVRAGLHCGPAAEEKSDVFGEAVNVAARMAGLSEGGRILTTGPTVGTLAPLVRQATREIEVPVVKGKGDEPRVFEVDWRNGLGKAMGVSNLPAALTAPSPQPAPMTPALKLRHDGVDVQVEPDRQTLSFGRDGGSDLIVADRRASRKHARIERRRDGYALVDQSTNGTYVSFDGELEFALKREEVILRGHGWIAFGHSVRDHNAEVVEFEVSDQFA